jgi:hypothetical protein
MLSPRLRRIAGFSRALAIVCAVLTPVAPLAVFLIALFAPLDALAESAGVVVHSPETAEGGRLLFGVVALVSALPLSFGLIRLATCFRGFAGGALFAAASVAGLRDFAGATLFWALSQPFFATVSGLVLTWGAPEGKRELALQLSSNTILLAVFALCVLTVSWVLIEASALSEENAQFV